MNDDDSIRALVAAYSAAAYALRLRGGSRAIVRLDAALPTALAVRLDEMFARDAAQVAAVITAWNPHSQPTAPGRNHRAQRKLLRRLREESGEVLVGVGLGPGWREPSLAVFGIALARIDELARDFGQHAVIVFAADAQRHFHPRLRLYTDAWRAALAGADVDFAPADPRPMRRPPLMR